MTSGMPTSVHSFMRTSLSFLDRVLLVVEYSPSSRCLYRSAMASGRPHATNDEALNPPQISLGDSQIVRGRGAGGGGTVSKYHPSSGRPSGYAAWIWRKRPSMLSSLTPMAGVGWFLVVSEVYSITSSADSTQRRVSSWCGTMNKHWLHEGCSSGLRGMPILAVQEVRNLRLAHSTAGAGALSLEALINRIGG